MPVAKDRRKQRAEVTADAARDNMRDVLNRVEFRGERIVITRHGKDAAVVVSMADLAKLEGAA